MHEVKALVTNIIPQIQAVIDSAETLLVVSHIDPDGDALGTQLAFGQYLKSIGKQVYMTIDSKPPEKYMSLPGIDKMLLSKSVPADIKFDAAIILECPTMRRAGDSARFLTADVRIVDIDHHGDSTELGEVNWMDPTSSSVGEMVYEYFEQIHFEITTEIAHCLFTAILTDTGRFRFASTSQRTFEIAGKLVALGADQRKACDDVYYSIRPSTLSLVGKVLNGIEFHYDERVCLLFLTEEMLAQVGAERSASEGLVDHTMFAKGVEIGGFLKEAGDNCTKVSLRSRDGIDVAAIASKFGGGGHTNAAGCVLELPIEEARTKLLAIFGELINDVG